MAIKKGRVSTGATATPRQGSETSSTNPNLSGRIVNGVSYDVAGKASEDPNFYYSEILDRFNHGDMSLEELYQYLSTGISGNKLSAEQREDFLKQMIDSMLAKRQLDEQRSYDNPLSQLQRLMAAGMSKDSALQALAGGAGSSGSGGSPLIGAAQSPAPSESFANEVSAKTAIANTAFQAVSCAANLASFGISIPGTLANNTIAQVSADVTKQAQVALQGVQTGVTALDAALHAGQISQSDYDSAIQSKNGILDALSSVAEKYPNSLASNFISSPDFSTLQNNPYSAKMASDYYQQQRAGQDYAKTMAHNYAILHGQELLNQANFDEINANINYIYANTRLLSTESLLKWYDLTQLKPVERNLALGNIDLNKSQEAVNWEQIPFMKMQQRVFGAQVKNINANTKLTLGQASLINWQKRVLKSTADLNNANASLATYNAADAMYDNLLKGRTYFGQTDGQNNMDLMIGATMSHYQFMNNLYSVYNGTEYQHYLGNYLINDIMYQDATAYTYYMWQSDFMNQMQQYIDDPTASQNWNRWLRGNTMITNPPFGGADYSIGGNLNLPFKLNAKDVNPLILGR